MITRHASDQLWHKQDNAAAAKKKDDDLCSVRLAKTVSYLSQRIQRTEPKVSSRL